MTRKNTIRHRILAGVSALLLIAFSGNPALAKGVDDDENYTGARGPVTNLPLPRFVSLKSDEGNVRRGPSLTHRIDWVFTRPSMPLQITAEYGHWRRVEDRDGAGGWVHYALLSGVRTVLVEQDMMPVYSRPDLNAPITANFELGVVARLGACNELWCKITAGGYRGWARKDKLWGVRADELRE